MEAAYQIAPDVHALPAYFPVPTIGLMTVNAYLVKGEQPYLVDTGLMNDKGAFAEALSKLIDLKDLRWIYLTHDDSDHIGSLHDLLERAPNAKVITSFRAMGRLSLRAPLPPPRAHFLNPGETLNIGDRNLKAMMPPTYDSPATTMVFDDRLGALFSSDCFGGPLHAPAQAAAQIPAEDLAKAQLLWTSVESPWVHGCDRKPYEKALDELRALKPEWILSTHLPPAKGLIDTFCDTLRRLPDSTPFAGPNQAAFAEMLKNMPHH